MTNEQEKLFELIKKFTEEDNPNTSPNAIYNILTKNHINSVGDLDLISLNALANLRGVGAVKLKVLRNIKESIPQQYTAKSAAKAINTEAKAIFGTVYDEVDQIVENMVADQKVENTETSFKILSRDDVYELIVNNEDIHNVYAWSPSCKNTNSMSVQYGAVSYVDRQQLIFRSLSAISIGLLRSKEIIFLQISPE